MASEWIAMTYHLSPSLAEEHLESCIAETALSLGISSDQVRSVIQGSSFLTDLDQAYQARQDPSPTPTVSPTLEMSIQQKLLANLDHYRDRLLHHDPTHIIHSVAELESAPYYLSGAVSQLCMGCHHGQRKLLLAELQFYHHTAEKAHFVVYAGSAPCEHLPILLNLYPHLKFILIDPNYHTFLHDYKLIYQRSSAVSQDHLQYMQSQHRNPHRKAHVDRLVALPMFFTNAKTNVFMTVTQKVDPGLNDWGRRYRTSLCTMLTDKTRIFVIQDYMTPALARQLREALDISRAPFLFVSDLRTAMYADHPSDLDYLWNDSLQMIFLRTLEPSHSMIKFHPPYFNEGDTSVADHADKHREVWDQMMTYGIDVLGNYARREYTYFEGNIIHLQAWAPRESCETRLIVSRDRLSALTTYDPRAWDRQFMSFKSLRNYTYHTLWEYLRELDTTHLYDGCFDCNLEIALLTQVVGRLVGRSDYGLDMSAIHGLLRDQKSVRRVLALRDKIDHTVGRRVAQCSTHGTLSTPIRTPYFYRLEPTETGYDLCKYQNDNDEQGSGLWQRDVLGTWNAGQFAWLSADRHALTLSGEVPPMKVDTTPAGMSQWLKFMFSG